MKNIYYCVRYGRVLLNTYYGSVLCKQRSFKIDLDCREIEINKYDADIALLADVKKAAEMIHWSCKL